MVAGSALPIDEYAVVCAGENGNGHVSTVLFAIDEEADNAEEILVAIVADCSVDAIVLAFERLSDGKFDVCFVDGEISGSSEAAERRKKKEERKKKKGTDGFFHKVLGGEDGLLGVFERLFAGSFFAFDVFDHGDRSDMVAWF